MSTNIMIKNTNQLCTLRLKPQNKVVGKDKTVSWKDLGTDGFVPPGQNIEIWVGNDRRVVIEELPS